MPRSFAKAFCAVLVSVLAHSSSYGASQPFFLQFTNEVSAAAKIGVLNRTLIPSKESEYRIWIGFGIELPEYAVRLRVDAQGRVRGELLAHYPRDLKYMGKDEADDFRKNISQACSNLRHGVSSDVCTVTFSTPPDWQNLYIKLRELGVETLPDESQLPKSNMMVLDGVAMLVEIRHGETYRAYEYSNPSIRSEQEAKAAAQIIRLVYETFGFDDPQ